MVTVEELLRPISEERPCGEDLSYDPALQELETAARGKPETQFSEAEPPDWKEVQRAGLDLFARGKDLRVALMLTVAWLELEGLPGFTRGLRLMSGLLENFWAAVYPQLDPEDNLDPLQRMNIVASLAMPVGMFGDPYRVLERLRTAPLTDSARLGRLTHAQLREAETAGPGGGDGLTPAQIDAAFGDTRPEFLADNHAAVTVGAATAQRFDDYLTGIVGANNAPDLSALVEELTALRKRLEPFAVERGTAGADPAPGGENANVQTPATGAREPAGSVTGEIRSREDVLRLLSQIAEYYARHEPSSPVPLLLKRAARWAAMDFLQIMSDLAPDSVPQVRTVTGEPAEAEG